MKKIILLLLFLSFSNNIIADTPLRIAVLAFGTVNWELQLIQSYELDKKYGISLEIRPVASAQAGKIALQSGATDMIVSDFIWVSRQRENGKDLVFAPYSTTSGALMVPNGTSITKIAQLQGKRLGIAGGSLDKNWLLLTALANQEKLTKFDSSIKKTYGAPPLLNQQLERGQLDALFNYWHYAARLEAKGYKRLLDGHDLLKQLGIEEQLPTLGYVFQQTWGESHSEAVKQFLKASVEAKDLLCESDEAWNSIKSLAKAENEQTARILRKRYCEGRIQSWGTAEKEAADQLMKLLHATGNTLLTGESGQIQPGTFWKNTPSYEGNPEQHSGM